MQPKPGLTQRILNPEDFLYPENLHCHAGHTAKEFIVLNNIQQPMRFFQVSGPLLEERYHGIYCEECMIKANLMAKAKNN